MINELVLICDASIKTQKFAIVDENGKPIYYGRIFEDLESSWDAELAAAKKAVWIASKIKENNNLKNLRLVLRTDVEAMRFQDHPKQKSYVLTWMSQKNGIDLKIEIISGGKNNPADFWTRKADGYQKFDQTQKYENLIKKVEV